MGYRVFSMKSGSSESREFEEAAMMAKEGIERMCDLADEMADQYGERRGGYYGGRGRYGNRGGYGNRYGERDEWDMMYDYGERRRRDSRGRYM